MVEVNAHSKCTYVTYFFTVNNNYYDMINRSKEQFPTGVNGSVNQIFFVQYKVRIFK